MRIECNHGVFAMAAGLVAAGYNMYNTGVVDIDVLSLARKASQLQIDDSIRFWFECARTNQVSVNPYWPRGHYAVISAYQGKLPSDLDPQHLDWIQYIPMALLVMYEATIDLFGIYQDMVTKREPGWKPAYHHGLTALQDFFETDCTERVLFVPNLLMSPHATDFVQKNDVTVVIGATLDAESIVHEVLHTSLAACRDTLAAYAAQRGTQGFACPDAMRELGYMRDNSVKSCVNAIEECIVRVLSSLMTGGGEKRLETHADVGFLGAAQVGRIFQENRPKSKEIADFISFLLERI